MRHCDIARVFRQRLPSPLFSRHSGRAKYLVLQSNRQHPLAEAELWFGAGKDGHELRCPEKKKVKTEKEKNCVLHQTFCPTLALRILSFVTGRTFCFPIIYDILQWLAMQFVL